MFYTILFLLACYNLYTNVKSFIKEHVVVENGAIAEIPKKAYISIGVTVIFHVMVAAVCILPSILFWERSSNMKKTVEITGILGQGVKVGNRAVIHSKGGPSYYTSQVVDVLERTSSGIEIETLNTIYKITYPQDTGLAEVVWLYFRYTR